MSSESDPPAYIISNTGFPQGYFLIRNIATGKLLDVEQDGRNDGAEIILFPEKESSHVMGFRDVVAENQVFFVDYLGALCSKASGHAIDIEGDGKLVIRHRRPVVIPFPNKISHPLPQFNYSPKTGQISVTFTYGSDKPGPNPASAASLLSKTYILTFIPARKPRGLLDDASDFFQGAASVISSPFVLAFGAGSSPAPSASASAAEVRRGEFDLREDELSEVDRAEDDAIDDSPDPIRRIRVIPLEGGADGDVGPKTRERRQWEIIPLLKSKAKTGTI